MRESRFTVGVCPRCNGLGEVANSLVVEYYVEVLKYFGEWSVYCLNCGNELSYGGD